MQLPNPSDPRAKRVLAVGAALVAGVIGIEWFSSRPKSAEETPAGFAVNVPIPPRPAETGLEAKPAVETNTDFDKLVALFREAASVPAALPVVEAFAKAFKEAPELEQAFEDFEKDQRSGKPQGTLKTFAHALAETPAFRQLVSRFAQDPGFRQVAIQLSARPDIKDTIHEILYKAQTAAARSGTGAAMRSGTQQGISATAIGRNGGPLARTIEAGSRQSASAPHAAGVAHAALAHIPDAHAAEGGRAGGPLGVGPQWQARPETHEVKAQLATIDNAEAKPASRFCTDDRFKQFRPFCTGDPAHLLPEFSPIEALIYRYGVWGACFVTRRYPSCLRVCSGDCVAKDAWSSCLEAYDGAELTCVKECQDRSEWCAVDPVVIDRLCVKTVDQFCTEAERSAFLAGLPAECGPLKNVLCKGDPPPMPAICKVKPDAPRCVDWCIENPTDMMCVCKADAQAMGCGDWCASNPKAISCVCGKNPDAPGCRVPTASIDCVEDPEAPGCRGASPSPGKSGKRSKPRQCVPSNVFGYCRDATGKLKPVPKEMAVLNLAYRLASQGKSLEEIAKLLNKKFPNLRQGQAKSGDETFNTNNLRAILARKTNIAVGEVNATEFKAAQSAPSHQPATPKVSKKDCKPKTKC